jgi:hypothetical protein
MDLRCLKLCIVFIIQMRKFKKHKKLLLEFKFTLFLPPNLLRFCFNVPKEHFSCAITFQIHLLLPIIMRKECWFQKPRNSTIQTKNQYSTLKQSGVCTQWSLTFTGHVLLLSNKIRSTNAQSVRHSFVASISTIYSNFTTLSRMKINNYRMEMKTKCTCKVLPSITSGSLTLKTHWISLSQ